MRRVGVIRRSTSLPPGVPLARFSALVLVLALAAGVALAGADSPPPPLHAGAPVYLVPLGPVPPDVLARLVDRLASRLGLRVQTLPPLSLEPAVMNHDREQVIAEEMLDLMRRKLASTMTNDAVTIGVTPYDMYLRSATWNWAFSYRERKEAVVSLARMDESNWGMPPSDERLDARLGKMVTKNLGILYYGLSESADQRSVLYSPILGLRDLDAIGDTF